MDSTFKDSVSSENLEHSSIQEQCSGGLSGKDTVNELIVAFEESLLVKDVKQKTNYDLPCTSRGDSILEEEMRAGTIDKLPNDHALTDEKDKGYTHKSQNLPKLVSALKGSRVREEATLRQLTVSWAPDVYDPLPSSVSHLPKKSSQQHYKNKKKHGKGKQKGKNSKTDTSSREKKHRHKTSTRVEQLAPKLTQQASLGSFVGFEKPIQSSNYKLTVGLLDLGIEVDDSPDSNCGSSFLRKTKSTYQLHCAEAS